MAVTKTDAEKNDFLMKIALFRLEVSMDFGCKCDMNLQAMHNIRLFRTSNMATMKMKIQKLIRNKVQKSAPFNHLVEEILINLMH